MSWWNLSPCSPLTSPKFPEEKSKCDSRKWIFRLIFHPIALYEVNRSCTTSWQFAAFWFPKKSLQILLNYNHSFLSILFRSSSNCLPCIISLIWGLINIPSSYLSHSRLGTYSSMAGFIHTFHKVCHVQREQINILRKNKKRAEDIFLPWRQWCSFSPQFIYIVILLVPAVPLAQETAVICVNEFHCQ